MSKTLTDDMVQFMSQYSLESVLSGIIEMQMLLYGHDDTFIPAAEYLAANALYACKENGDKNFMWHDYELLEQYSKSSFAPNVEQLFSETLKMVNASDDEKQKFLQSKMMQMKGNFYRGDGYIHQLLEVARRLYVPLDTSMKNVLGFSYTTYEKTLRFIFSQYGLRISEAYKDKYTLKTMFKALVGKSEPWLPSIKSGYIFRISKSDLKVKIGDEIDKMCDYLCVRAYDSGFKKAEFDEFKILTSKPFVDFGDYIYMPLLFSSRTLLPGLKPPISMITIMDIDGCLRCLRKSPMCSLRNQSCR